MSMRKLLTEAYFFTKSNFAALFRIIGPFVLVMAFFGVFVAGVSIEEFWIFWVYMFVFTCGHSFYMCRVIKYMASAITGKEPDLTVSFSEWANLLTVHILYGIAVGVGLIALVIPGIYISAKYGFAEFEAVLNGKAPFKAFGTSWEQTKGIALKLMLASALVGLCVLLINTGLSMLGEANLAMSMFTGFIAELVSTTSLIFVTVVYFRLYVLGLETQSNHSY